MLMPLLYQRRRLTERCPAGEGDAERWLVNRVLEIVENLTLRTLNGSRLTIEVQAPAQTTRCQLPRPLLPPNDKLPITISSACIAFGFNANRYVYYGYSFPLSMTFIFRKADGWENEGGSVAPGRHLPLRH
jgi:hypothetical protein